MKMRTVVTVSLAAVIMALSFSTYAGAEEKQDAVEPQAQEKKEVVVRKEVTGLVSGISNAFIAVEFGQSHDDGAGLEMAFTIGRDVRVIHKQGLKEIKQGDTVTVAYDEITKTNDDGRKLIRREVRAVTFLKPAPKRPDEATDTPETLHSRGSEEPAPLTIKGPKKE